GLGSLLNHFGDQKDISGSEAYQLAGEIRDHWSYTVPNDTVRGQLTDGLETGMNLNGFPS
ncbi:MAG: hypothetical protein AB1758_14490, partial [Candidatus Eremiobacterota bacterium]